VSGLATNQFVKGPLLPGGYTGAGHRDDRVEATHTVRLADHDTDGATRRTVSGGAACLLLSSPDLRGKIPPTARDEI
jgi:hypothetical protein